MMGEQTGVIVKFIRKDGSAYFQRGDLLFCPTCGVTMVDSFGELYEGEKREPFLTVKK
jgi:hypothetical protein